MIALNRQMKILIVVLAVQAVGLLFVYRAEKDVAATPLSEFPKVVGQWSLLKEGVVEQEVQDELRADDVLTRIYRRRSDRSAVSLFIAYFRSQRTGKAPHSPKNCLPGSGWTPSISDTVTLDLGPGRPPLQANRYVVTKGDSESIVLYWYQSRDRSVASEYLAKVYVVLDSIRFNRSDTSLVRVVVPVVDDDMDKAMADATSFARSVALLLPRLDQFRGAGAPTLKTSSITR